MRTRTKLIQGLWIGALIAVGGISQAQTWTGGGDGSSWTDGANWDSAPNYPGDAVTAGTNVWIAGINGGGVRTVNLDAALVSDVGAAGGNQLRIDAGQGAGSSTTLNVLPGASVSATAVGNTLLTINEGGPNDPTAAATVNLQGSLTVGQIRLGRDSGTTTLAVLPGGSLNMTGGGHLEMRADRTDTVAIFSMTGGNFISGGNRELRMGNVDSRVILGGDSIFDGQNLTLRMDYRANPGESSLSVDGSGLVMAQFKAINAYANAANTTGSATVNFIADAGGLSPITSIGLLDLSGDSSQKDADVVIDMTGYTGGATSFELFSYGTLAGEFGSVSVIGATLDSISYGSGTADVITLNVIPEPSTLALLGLGGLAVWFSRKRRQS